MYLSYSSLVVFGFMFIFLYPMSIDCNHRCIHYFVKKYKNSICNSRTTNYTRIPDKLPALVGDLTVSHQYIRILTADQFTKLDKLRNLTLSNNSMIKVESDAFKHVKSLQKLVLTNNSLYLRANSFPRTCLLNLKELLELDLSDNPLGYVPFFFFQYLRNLKVLRLSGANVGFVLQNNSFSGLVNLEVLDISRNHLKTIRDYMLLSLNKMPIKEFYFHLNPLYCDCRLIWLKKLFIKNPNIKYSTNYTNKYLNPICKQPKELHNHLFLTHHNKNIRYNKKVNINDLRCPPKIFTRNRVVSKRHGSNVTLVCDFHAIPTGVVLWSRNGLMVMRHWRNIKWYQNKSGPRFKAWLKITNINSNDFGKWKCMLNNEAGSANATFELVVKDAFKSLNIKTILKYVGIGTITLILVLVVVGVIIYCVYGFKINRNTSNISITQTSIINKENIVNPSTNNPSTHNNTNAMSLNKHYYKYNKPIYQILPNYQNQQLSIDKINSPPIISGSTNGQIINYCNPILLNHANNPTIIQPCLEQTQLSTIPTSNHNNLQSSPFSHYLLNQNSSALVCNTKSSNSNPSTNSISHNCPVHGESLLSHNNPTQPDVTNTHSANCTNNKSGDSVQSPCPLHGNMLISLPSLVNTTQPAIDIVPKTNINNNSNNDNINVNVNNKNDDTESEFVLRVSSSNPIVLVTATQSVDKPNNPLGMSQSLINSSTDNDIVDSSQSNVVIAQSSSFYNKPRIISTYSTDNHDSNNNNTSTNTSYNKSDSSTSYSAAI